MAGDGVVLDLQIVRIAALVVRLEDAVGDGAFPGRLFVEADRFPLGNEGIAVEKKYAGVIELDHVLHPF